jgi:hypothetical protein
MRAPHRHGFWRDKLHRLTSDAELLNQLTLSIFEDARGEQR